MKKRLLILLLINIGVVTVLTGAATLYDSSPELSLRLDDPIVITRLSSAGVKNLEQFWKVIVLDPLRGDPNADLIVDIIKAEIQYGTLHSSAVKGRVEQLKHGAGTMGGDLSLPSVIEGLLSEAEITREEKIRASLLAKARLLERFPLEDVVEIVTHFLSRSAARTAAAAYGAGAARFSSLPAPIETLIAEAQIPESLKAIVRQEALIALGEGWERRDIQAQVISRLDELVMAAEGAVSGIAAAGVYPTAAVATTAATGAGESIQVRGAVLYATIESLDAAIFDAATKLSLRQWVEDLLRSRAEERHVRERLAARIAERGEAFALGARLIIFRSRQASDEDCPICTEKDEEQVAYLRCGHTVGSECFWEQFTRYRTSEDETAEGTVPNQKEQNYFVTRLYECPACRALSFVPAR